MQSLSSCSTVGTPSWYDLACSGSVDFKVSKLCFYALVIIADFYAFDAEFELPVGMAQAAASSGSHSISVWGFSLVTILFLISFETEWLRVSGRWRSYKVCTCTSCSRMMPDNGAT